MNDLCVFCMLNKNPLIFHEKFKVKTLHESNNFKIICDYQPVSLHHILIVSKKHHFSMQDLDSKELKELTELKTNISNFYSSKLELNTFFFEHGSGKDNCDSSCIEHAHMHAVPLTQRSSKELLIQLLHFLGQPSVYATSKAYLMADFSSNNQMYWHDKKVRHQFFRILIADLLGNVNRGVWQHCSTSEIESSISRQYYYESESLWQDFTIQNQ